MIIGRDSFLTPSGKPLRPGSKADVDIRFHLHPQIRMAVNSDGLIELTANRDDTWVFTCTEVAPHMEESLFFAGISGPQRTRMIVLQFAAADHPEVNWQFTRTKLGYWSR